MGKLAGCCLLLYLVGGSVAHRVAQAGVQRLAYRTVDLEVAGTAHRVTLPEGYRIEVLVDGLQRPRLLTFAPNGDRWARVVGVAVGPDGALYFASDDGANVRFRLSLVSVPQSASASGTASR